MRYILLLILVSSCSLLDFIDEPHYEVDKELEPYVNKFLHEAKVRGYNIDPPNLIVKLEQIGSICGVSKGYQMPIVSIDIDFFEINKIEGNEDDIELAVYHELGHALLRLEHTNEFGIMGINMPWEEYGANKKSMIDNLFLLGI